MLFFTNVVFFLKKRNVLRFLTKVGFSQKVAQLTLNLALAA